MRLEKKFDQKNMILHHASRVAQWKRAGPITQGQWIETISC